jgi:two-component system, LuxR family, response regulator FixJ
MNSRQSGLGNRFRRELLVDRAHDDHVDVVLVDHDVAVYTEISNAFAKAGLSVRHYNSGEHFLQDMGRFTASCILMDVQLPGQSGIELLRKVGAAKMPAPVLVMSQKGDVTNAVQAIKLGALDFLEKPFDVSHLFAKLQDVLVKGGDRYLHTTLHDKFEHIDDLTTRQRQILEYVVSGASNKEIGRVLGISTRTVEVHRARVMARLGVRKVADLVRLVLSEH